MAEYLIQDTTLTDIADAIRGKLNVKDKIKTSDMPSKIESITTVENYVNTKATVIGQYAFSDYTGLKNVEFTEALEIGENAFDASYINEYHSKTTKSILETASFPKATTIKPYAFYYCQHLKNVNLPSVTTINNSAFCDCTALENIDLPSVTEIDSSSFANCTALENIDLPNVTTINGTAFFGCTSLENINLPNVTTIKQGVFSGCTSLKNVDLPSLKSLIYSAFSNCNSLTSLVFPKLVDMTGNPFDNCNNLNTIVLPSIEGFYSNGVSTDTFKNCNGLTSLVIQNESCVVFIGFNASGFLNNTPIKNGTGFIYVPDSLVNSYKTSEQWTDFASAIKPLSQYNPS